MVRWLASSVVATAACTASAPPTAEEPPAPAPVQVPLAIPAEPVPQPGVDQLVLEPQLLGPGFSVHDLTAVTADGAHLSEGAVPPVVVTAVLREDRQRVAAAPEYRAVELMSASQWRARLLGQPGGAEDPVGALLAYLDDRDDADPASLPWPLHGEDALVLRTRIERLDFASGPGVRYLAAYSPAVAPLGNGDLYYVFEGVTRDGRYHVAFQLPVATGLLRHPPKLVTSEELARFADQADEYAAAIAGELATAGAEAFEPSLERLDAFARSIAVR
jgi:hypothetical protein